MSINSCASTPCPNLSKRVRALPGAESFVYWAELGYSQKTKDHSLCNEDDCYANDLRLESYVTRHAQDGCDCPFLGADPLTVKSIYAAGSFPVVALRNHAGKVVVEVRKYEPGLCYVAISHALSDGRGNAKSATLPTCQLSQIDQWVRDLKPVNGASVSGGYFWMDTLCIPSHLTISTKYEEAARASFKQSTEKASSTLVLDSDIQILSRASTCEEAFIRINFSSWSSRMWTLQEAVLTPKVFLQLKDGIITFEEIILMHSEGSSKLTLPIEEFLVYRELRRYLVGISPQYVTGSDGHLAALREALRNRRTSNEEDKPLIVANILGIDVQSLPETTLSQVFKQKNK